LTAKDRIQFFQPPPSELVFSSAPVHVEVPPPAERGTVPQWNVAGIGYA
jgi:hypothetical protein